MVVAIRVTERHRAKELPPRRDPQPTGKLGAALEHAEDAGAESAVDSA